MSTDPSRSPASTAGRSFARTRPVSSAIESGRSPPSTAGVRFGQILRGPCAARRGAVRPTLRSAPSSAPWRPPSSDARSALSATTVLPEPTSPWRRRCIGSGDGEVLRDLAQHLSLGRRQREVMADEEPPYERRRGIAQHRAGADVEVVLTDRMADAGRGLLESTASQCEQELETQELVEDQAPPAPGRCRPSSRAGGCPRTTWCDQRGPARLRTDSGTGSSIGPARRSDSSMNPPISQLVRPALPDAG